MLYPKPVIHLEKKDPLIRKNRAEEAPRDPLARVTGRGKCKHPRCDGNGQKGNPDSKCEKGKLSRSQIVHATTVAEGARSRISKNIHSAGHGPLFARAMFVPDVFVPDLVILPVTAPGPVERLKNLGRQDDKRRAENVTQKTKDSQIILVTKKVVGAEGESKNGIEAEKPEKTAVRPLGMVVYALSPRLAGRLLPVGKGYFHQSRVHAEALKNDTDVNGPIRERILVDRR